MSSAARWTFTVWPFAVLKRCRTASSGVAVPAQVTPTLLGLVDGEGHPTTVELEVEGVDADIRCLPARGVVHPAIG